jgi:hypothetical protein
MNSSQKKYIRNLKLGLMLFCLFAVLLYFLPNNLFSPGKIMIASAIVVACIKIIAASGIGGEGRSSENITINELIEKYPILKVWYFICFIGALFFSIYIYSSGASFVKELGIGKTALIIFLLILPLYLPKLIIEEYEKFLRL